MWQDPLFIVVAIAVLAVLILLMIGIGGFVRGGDFNRKHGNRLMRYRIMAQAAAIAVVLAFVFLRRMGSN
ncbi:MAG: twin transmembrane helix small protein [Rhodobacteraceae bacterium]|nr:twin transmembrane helix small protein [Paracoccaceae bacterium]